MASQAPASEQPLERGAMSSNGIDGYTPSPQQLGAHKYRGAVVEDLQLPPAFTLPDDEKLGRAVEMAYDRDFSYIPILSHKRKPLGYLDVKALKSRWESGTVDTKDSVTQHMSRFKRGPPNTYTVITPDTPLESLETFLEEKDDSFAIITDYGRNFVLGVATREDLLNFVTRSGYLKSSPLR